MCGGFEYNSFIDVCVICSNRGLGDVVDMVKFVLVSFSNIAVDEVCVKTVV